MKTRSIAFVMVLVMLLTAFCGCAQQSDAAPDKEAAKKAIKAQFEQALDELYTYRLEQQDEIFDLYKAAYDAVEKAESQDELDLALEELESSIDEIPTADMTYLDVSDAETAQALVSGEIEPVFYVSTKLEDDGLTVEINDADFNMTNLKENGWRFSVYFRGNEQKYNSRVDMTNSAFASEGDVPTWSQQAMLNENVDNDAFYNNAGVNSDSDTFVYGIMTAKVDGKYVEVIMKAKAVNDTPSSVDKYADLIESIQNW